MTNASEITFRVNYSETDRMGVAYYARHAVWLDMARTEFLRERGMTYREVEDMGFRLVVAEMKIRYRKPAEYDDLILVRCWVEDLGSRRILFAYSIENGESRQVLAKAETTMVFLDANFTPSRMPKNVMAALTRIPEPIPR
ncbi:MAG: acyl-CoA thioesterase [Gemmatimonadales bacterium]|nr:acyl-CoA thioesterase [Gemmatimonadales bacterium]